MPKVTHADVVENIEDDAAARRKLQGNNLFEQLGEPIQRVLLALESEGQDTDEKTLQLLGHITVKQLAKVFEMLEKEMDEDTILAWLKRRARKNRKKHDQGAEDLKAKIKTGADRDPIAFFKAMEQENQERIAEQQQMQEERDKLRMAKTAEREKKRAQQQEDAEAAKKAMEEDGQWWKATDALPEKAKNAINSAFEKFANDASGFDNSNKDQDGEWWKKDPYRRDWERNKGNGKKWTAVIEGSKEPATEAELAVREEFYKSNDWWKADKYKRDWEATKDNEWWKEEPYIQDWQANKHEGTRWRAADEESGLDGEANTYPASPEEQKRREEWYQANGPRGVVKRWNAATEGDVEKCSVPEKLEREEYYRDGDWWKGDGARLDFKDQGLDCPALQFAKADDAKDKEWWKAGPYREDFWAHGPKGKKWTALNEDGGIDGTGDKAPAPELEQKKREDWYRDNWWKADKYKDDYKKKGPAGKLWKAPNQKEAESGSPSKSIGPEEARKREEWYKERAPDEEWWKAPEYVRDYHQNGDAGRHWPAKTKASGLAGKGQEDPAGLDEQKKREEWYKENWFKQPKYVEDYHKNPNAAAAPTSAAWSKKSDDPGKDKEWWKQPVFVEDWSKSMAPKTKPAGDEWWKQPEYIEDYQAKGPDGRRWTGAKESVGVAAQGHEQPASDDEKKKREEWYGANWWKAPQYATDWAVKGPRGERWQAGSKPAADDPSKGATAEPISPDERREREAWYRPQGDMWRANGEPEGFEAKAKEFPCRPEEALKRDAWYRANWWKAPEYQQDWKENGPKGKKWTAGSEETGKAGEGDKDPATEEERRARDQWYRNQSDVEWWKEPAYIEDWARNGDGAKCWTADTRPNAQRYGGDEHPADPEEKKKREDWYKDNWWKTPQAADDWKKRGKDGDHWTRKDAPAAQQRDPETEGENWWKQPAFIEDWLRNGPDAKCWTAEDPVSAATAQGHKKPATDDEKAKRDKWYRDNFWKAPSCADDWSKNGPKGKEWLSKDPDACKGGEGDKDPAAPDELKKREDWYKQRGDKDDWWKRPEFVEDFQDNGESGKGWTAANPTAGALGQGLECPAARPEKQKRADWYKDNWWKAPKYAQAWKKGEDAWAKDTPGAMKEAPGPEKRKREDWYKANAGEPADDAEKAKREDWYKKNGGEPSGAQLAKREDWLKRQLPDSAKAKRMEWLKERAPNDKRILAEELPEALAAINEGQQPSEEQVAAVMDQIKKNREAQRDDFADDEDGMKRPEEEDETVGQDEFLQAVADTNFYVAPDKEELEMQAEEAKEQQEMQEMARMEEEAAFLAMEKEEEIKNTPEAWQKKAKVDVGNKDEWWKQPEFIENYQQNPEGTGDSAHWAKDPKTKEPVSEEEQAAREQWYKDNWWKAPEYSQQWRRDDMGDEGHGDGWKKNAKPPPVDPDAEDDARPEEGMEEATPEEIAERERWYRNAKAPERTFQDPAAAADEWWKQPQFVEAFQEGDDSCFRNDQDEAGECSPEEKEKREQWFKDNWWKAPKHVDEWRRQKQDGDDGMARKDKDDPASAGWSRAAQPPKESEDDDGMQRADDEAPIEEATPEEISEREAWYEQATEAKAPEEPKPKPKSTAWERAAGEAPFVGEKFIDPVEPKRAGWGRQVAQDEPPPADDAPAEAPKTSAWTREPPFVGEKFPDEPPPGEEPEEPPFVGEKFPDEPEPEEEEEEEPFVGEKFTEEEMPSLEAFQEKEPPADEAEDDDEPFFGEKFFDGEPPEMPAPANPFTGEKFENEDDRKEPEFEGEKIPDQMKDEDPRELDEEEEVAFEEKQAEQEKEEQDELEDEEKAWEEGTDGDDEDEDSESDDDEGDNEHQDDEDMEAELEAELLDEDCAWVEGEEEEEEEEVC